MNVYTLRVKEQNKLKKELFKSNREFDCGVEFLINKGLKVGKYKDKVIIKSVWLKPEEIEYKFYETLVNIADLVYLINNADYREHSWLVELNNNLATLKSYYEADNTVL